MNIRYCNICGGQMDYWDVNEDFTIHTYAGYGSRYDGEEIELHVCCDCMGKLIEKCSISPIVREPDVGMVFGNKLKPDDEQNCSMEESNES